YNYRFNRLANVLHIEVSTYTNSELISLCKKLVQKVNISKDSLQFLNSKSNQYDSTSEQLFNEAIKAYKFSAFEYSFLYYPEPSIKPSMFGFMMNYIQVDGYFNPFTGEAQVNTSVPFYIQPFLICHEIAHQIGFSAEYSANFIGYLVSTHSSNREFQYAGNFEMMMYAFGELRYRDSTIEKKLWHQINPGVKQDVKTLNHFYQGFRNPFGVFTSNIYNQYLKINQQREGIRSYDEVVSLLIQFDKKKSL
ncbi:MAG: DUF3810 domain-containing protein, partial [Chitinophagaceae bacterium]